MSTGLQTIVGCRTLGWLREFEHLAYLEPKAFREVQMKRRVMLLTLAAAVVLLGSIVVPTGAGAQSQQATGNAKLKMYEAVVDAATVEQLTSEGYDVASVERVLDGFRVILVLHPSDVIGLEKQGIDLELWTNDAGLTSDQLAAQQAAAGFKVWMDYDGPDGFRQYMSDLAAANEDILDLHVVGQTWGTDPEGDDPDTPRDIVALRLTDEATDVEGQQKPAVLYSSLIHAREWITGEVNRRLLEWYIKGWREEKPEVVNILTSTELWFVLVQNPDGYQYTFDHDRLWRKNLRDNDPDGSGPLLPDNRITIGDGVDGNRNFEEHWRFDDEGSASLPSDETYRGPSAMSEPETQALDLVLQMSQPEYHISYHSFGDLLLYPFGFQVNTPSADDPLFVAWAGTDRKPAVHGYDPGVGADLYTTNGEQTDYAYSKYGALSITPELGEGNQASGFEFPDSEGEVEHEFKINLNFAVAAAKSAADPDDPVSPVNIEAEPFYMNTATIDPQKSFNPMSDFTFAHSFNGEAQPVRILARRDLDNDGDEDDVMMHYSIGGADPVDVPATEWEGGDRYGETAGEYYHVVGADVTDAPAGSDVEVWFSGADITSPSFTFHVEKATANDVLILADTDYTGTSNFPAYTPADGTPPFVSDYAAAISASGRTFDVYNVDALGAAPDHLGVLGHYDAVVWYTANDLLSRIPGQPGGTGAETQANTMMLEVRAFLNEGGRLLYTGRHAGWQFANAFDYNPVSTPPLCDAVDLEADDGCLFLSDDFLQYWLGAYLFVEDGGTDTTADPDAAFDVGGAAPPYDAAGTDPWEIDQQFDAGRGATTQSFITTSSLLDEVTFPQFTSTAPAEWLTGISGPYEPHSPTHYVYSQRADIRLQRLMNTFTVPAGDSQLSFFTSYDTEPNWDFLFVELLQPDGTWITLPEASDPSFTSDNTGESCPEGWHELHPWLEQYQGADCGADTDGDGFGNAEGWNAASGRSHGWENWVFDLSAYEGQEVTVSISYASDWAVQGLGVFLDDIDAPGTTADTDFEAAGMAGWEPGNPEDVGSGPNALDWISTTDVGFIEGAMTSMTPTDAAFRTLYFGFGFENVSGGSGDTTGADARAEIMTLALDYLIGP
jgi:Zinc carboxypeptidase